MLLDSNAIIYSIKPEFVHLRALIAEKSPAVSAISYVEVLGYHQLTECDKQDFMDCFFDDTDDPYSSRDLRRSGQIASAAQNVVRRLDDCGNRDHQ